MIIGKVTGTIVSTRKYSSLTGSKFLVVDLIDGTGGGKGAKRQIVAVDGVGAGVGEKVLITTGSSARIAYRAAAMEEAPIDALIVGIIDE